MNYIGHPESPPSWNTISSQSYIEEKFTNQLDDFANFIESEHWFGDHKKPHRFRVDFILKDARLIVELDGYEYHSSKEQLKKDAIRQRYLVKAGYTVIRFTCEEIKNDAKGCVMEVRELYNEIMQRQPVKYKVMYIDYPYLLRETSKALAFYRELHPNKNLKSATIQELLPHAIDWLHEKSCINVHIFYPSEYKHDLEGLNKSVCEYSKGEIRISTIETELYSLDLAEHMENFSHLYDEFMLIADDQIYIESLCSILQKEKVNKLSFLTNGKLLRNGNENTAFRRRELAVLKWQKIWYPIAASLGLEVHEM